VMAASVKTATNSAFLRVGTSYWGTELRPREAVTYASS
jgi:hypothetical protein